MSAFAFSAAFLKDLKFHLNPKGLFNGVSEK